MQTVSLSTNLHCASCVANLKTTFDREPRIHHWTADLERPEKTVIVHGDLAESEVIALVQKAGYIASPEKASLAETVACEMPMPHKTLSASGFWQDILVWRRASFNTLNCLVGCSIGDFGMVIYLQAFHPATPMWLQMLLAVVAGLITSVLLETVLLHRRERMNWKTAFRMAVSMSFLSMIAMEIAMNTTDFMITGGKMALSDPRYWLAFAPAAVAGFLTPLPYNYWKLKKHNRACH